MTEREKLLENADAYLLVGDQDKEFHEPRCECFRCERWRERKGRPTHQEIRRLKVEERIRKGGA